MTGAVCAARTAIEAAGICIAENIQLSEAHWLPQSRILAVPGWLTEPQWGRIAARLSSSGVLGAGVQ